MLTVANRRFLIFIFLGYMTFVIIDIIAALGMNPGYTFSTESWVFYSLVPCIIITELFCFYYDCLSSARGVFFTVIGGMTLFHNNYEQFESQVFYPFTGTEYVPSYSPKLVL